MIRNFFVLSPRGDTILAKTYRNDNNEGAHERSHTEALFRKIQFWDDLEPENSQKKKKKQHDDYNNISMAETAEPTDAAVKRTGDAPPVLMMPDGFTYFYIKRNGLIFGASTTRNVSPSTVLEVCIRERTERRFHRGLQLYVLTSFFYLSSFVSL
jgi:AP-4 complex subunit mu-1